MADVIAWQMLYAILKLWQEVDVILLFYEWQMLLLFHCDRCYTITVYCNFVLADVIAKWQME